MIKNWYAVYTKPQQEQKATAALAKRGIESFCPLTRVSAYKGFGKKIDLLPLLPSFVFVHITETQFAAVRQTNSVINFMYWLGGPAVIPAAEIKSIQQFAGTYQNLKVEKAGIIKKAMASVGSERFQQSFKDVAGVQKLKIKLSLPSLGFILIAETEKPATTFHYNFEIKEMLSNLQQN